MRVLLIAWYFPPDGGPGAQRPISFARHLPGLGVAVTVLTRSPPAVRGKFDPADPGALPEIERRVRIVRAAGDGARLAPALPELVAAGDAAIRAERPDVILATMSPFPLWRVAHELGARHGLPFVADLRDPWALDGVSDWRTWWHWRREFAEMRRMLRAAAGVIANTPECRGLLLAAEPALAPDAVTAITNGFEEADFAPPAPRIEPRGTLRLLHAGSFLCGELYAHERPLRRWLGWLRHRPEPLRPSGRTPRHLLAALRALRERGEPAGREVRFVTIGAIDAPLERCVRESGVADAVELLPYRAHRELVAAVREADALFLTLHGLRAGARSRIVPGKTYEYLAAGRPILAALPPGDARELVAASPRAFVADPVDEAGLARALAALHAKWRTGAFGEPASPPGVQRFTRRALAGELVAFLARVAVRPRAAGGPRT